MAEKKTLVVYAAVYETAEAALADLDAIEQLRKDELIGSYDAAVIDQENGKSRVVKRMDRPHMRVVPEWFGGGALPRKELREAAEELRANQAGLIAVGEPTIEKGLEKAFTGATRVVKRAVGATTDEITSELQEALKGAGMSSTGGRSNAIDMHLEVDVIPVSDVERSKQFYERLGWRLDDDTGAGHDIRVVQFTPPGSGCSVTFGHGITQAAPGSGEATLTVSDIESAHEAVVGRGIDASEMWHGPPFPPEARISGPDPQHTSYGSFFSFNDPDDNLWLVQEVTTRMPGRV
jgi:catechol 2,3-dioxygenase-like lactoylglutathione lyase family enzyme